MYLLKVKRWLERLQWSLLTFPYPIVHFPIRVHYWSALLKLFSCRCGHHGAVGPRLSLRLHLSQNLKKSCRSFVFSCNQHNFSSLFILRYSNTSPLLSKFRIMSNKRVAPYSPRKHLASFDEHFQKIIHLSKLPLIILALLLSVYYGSFLFGEVLCIQAKFHPLGLFYKHPCNPFIQSPFSLKSPRP